MSKPSKYQIVYAVQDFYFCEVGERKKFKKYLLMHFSKNKKGTGKELVNFCFSAEEVAKSKLKNCRVREKGKLVMKWIKLLKEGELKFRDYRGRDWFLSLLKTNQNNM